MYNSNVFYLKKLTFHSEKKFTVKVQQFGLLPEPYLSCNYFLRSSLSLLKRIISLQHRCEVIRIPLYFNGCFQMSQECFHPSSKMSLQIDHANSCLIECSYVPHFFHITTHIFILQQRCCGKDYTCSAPMSFTSKSCHFTVRTSLQLRYSSLETSSISKPYRNLYLEKLFELA